MQTPAFDEDIARVAQENHMPDGQLYRSLSLQSACDIARSYGMPLQEVEIAALEREIIPQRYARNFKAYTIGQQLKLLRSKVLLVGLGGLGGTLLELLCRIGVGAIVAADGDVFEESNCNRQLLCSLKTLGQPKSVAAEERARNINPGVNCRALHEKLDRERMAELMRGVDLVVDALGGLECRPALWSAAQEAGVPMVSAAVAGSSGVVGVFFPGDMGPELLFGQAGSTDPGTAAEDALGTQGPCVHMAASLQAAEILRLLTEEKSIGRVLFFDLADMTFERMRF